MEVNVSSLELSCTLSVLLSIKVTQLVVYSIWKRNYSSIETGPPRQWMDQKGNPATMQLLNPSQHQFQEKGKIKHSTIQKALCAEGYDQLLDNLCPPVLDTPFVNIPIPEYHWHFLLTSPHPPSYSVGKAFFIFFNLQPSSHTNHKYQLVCCYTLTFWGWRHCCEVFFEFVVCLQFVFLLKSWKKQMSLTPVSWSI